MSNQQTTTTTTTWTDARMGDILEQLRKTEAVQLINDFFAFHLSKQHLQQLDQFLQEGLLKALFFKRAESAKLFWRIGQKYLGMRQSDSDRLSTLHELAKRSVYYAAIPTDYDFFYWWIDVVQDVRYGPPHIVTHFKLEFDPVMAMSSTKIEAGNDELAIQWFIILMCCEPNERCRNILPWHPKKVYSLETFTDTDGNGGDEFAIKLIKQEECYSIEKLYSTCQKYKVMGLSGPPGREELFVNKQLPRIKSN